MVILRKMYMYTCKEKTVLKQITIMAKNKLLL